MSVGNGGDGRIDVLEAHVAELGRVIDDLNTTVTAQWAALDALKRQLSLLTDRIAETEDRAATPTPQRPPHY